MRRAVVAACNAAYADGVRGMLRSVWEHHPEVARYGLAPPGEAAAVAALLGDLNEVRGMPRVLRGVPAGVVPQIMAARVFVPTIPAEAVAWVDSDVEFCRPAPELWDVQPGKVNVVRDQGYDLGQMVPPELWERFHAVFPLAPDAVAFNSGVFALRPAAWRDLPEQFEAAVVAGDYPYYPHPLDQPILNGLMLGSANWLPREYNAHCAWELGVPRHVRLLHFTHRVKPWATDFDWPRPEYHYWVRYAEGVTDPTRLAHVRAANAAHTVRRLGYRSIRKTLTLLTGRLEIRF